MADIKVEGSKLSFLGFSSIKDAFKMTLSLVKPKKKEMEESLDEKQSVKLAFGQAKLELAAAENQLNSVKDKQDIDMALERIALAEKNIDFLIKRAKVIYGLPLNEKKDKAGTK